MVDASVRRHLPGDWETKVRNRIRRADLVVVICGAQTHEAEGVAAEVKMAQEEGKPYFFLKGREDRICMKSATALDSDAIHEWTWDNLRKQIEGKTLAESVTEWLDTPTPWILAGIALGIWAGSRNSGASSSPARLSGTSHVERRVGDPRLRRSSSVYPGWRY